MQAAFAVALNGVGNVIDGDPFFEGWQGPAIMGFIGGAASGAQLADEQGLDPTIGISTARSRSNARLKNNIANTFSLYETRKAVEAGGLGEYADGVPDGIGTGGLFHVKNYSGQNGLTIDEYSRYPYGLRISVAYNTNDVDGLYWTQMVWTDYSKKGYGSVSFWDHGGSNPNYKSFHYYSDETMANAHTFKDKVTFYDIPHRTGIINCNWQADLSLYKGNNRIFSLYYGFSMTNNKLRIDPLILIR